jgi:hypothetical protein
MRTVLKKPQIEKSIKIGGGQKPAAKKENEEAPKEKPKEREKKRTRKKRSSKEEKVEAPREGKEAPAEKIDEEVLQRRRTLLPPPTSLISDQIDRYKNYLIEQGVILPEDMEGREEKIEEIPKVEGDTPLSEKILPNEKVVDINEEVHVPTEDEES